MPPNGKRGSVYPWEDFCPGMTMIFRKYHVWRGLFPKPWNCSLCTVLSYDQISVASYQERRGTNSKCRVLSAVPGWLHSQPQKPVVMYSPASVPPRTRNCSAVTVALILKTCFYMKRRVLSLQRVLGKFRIAVLYFWSLDVKDSTLNSSKGFCFSRCCWFEM